MSQQHAKIFVQHAKKKLQHAKIFVEHPRKHTTILLSAMPKT